MDAPSHPILLFDGVCNLCNGMIRFILKRDRKDVFRFAALQSPAGQSQLARFGLSPHGMPSVVLVEGDRYFQRSTAVLKVLAALGWPYKALSILALIPRPLRDLGYAMIARNRYRIFGKRDACMMPTPEIRARFL
jgi:predicted DCC family thiol-disulfide oxidoreductase YuxK